MTDMSYNQRRMLDFLVGVPGCDVWERFDASICRELENLKLVRIVKARNAPKDGAKRQPYFGVKITAAGRKAIGHD